ncbi:MAG: 2-hydroxyhepta-2,4-diene-1,7-dioate isomerase, partial [Rhodospirillaceae bacterium]|nr:2-hydroxyhepta-2,4-diene-1,7-dioate isomerase [Rhodospirillaceae bacterium]
MTLWGRFDHAGSVGFGTIEGDAITIHEGDMFAGAKATGETLSLADVKLLAPCEPTKMIALWNNFHALAAKLEVAEPEEPLYLLKGNNSFLGPDELVRRPKSYDGKVGYEGELGIVIGKECKEVSEDTALDFVFGYTCINDVTAME